jgi:bacterioferritin-associated ferredoxin
MASLVPYFDSCWPEVTPRAMTRCECAGVTFVEVERRMREERLSLEEVTGRTGCGRTCTACLPDLRRHLAARLGPQR